jgi:iron complex outermembrane recepter protein
MYAMNRRLMLGSALLCASAAHAAEEQVEEVTVTAQKWLSTAYETPLSLSTLEGEELRGSGLTLLREVDSYMPNLFIRVDGDRAFNKPAVRGIVSGAFSDPALLVYVDDVPMDLRLGLALPLDDVERVEMIRGPQGSTYGQSTTGGVITMSTRAPASEQWTLNAQATVGNYDYLTVPVAIEGPVQADRAWLRVSLAKEQRDGYLENVARPGNDDSRERTSGRVALHIEGERVLTDISAYVVDADDGGYGAIRYGQDPDRRDIASNFDIAEQSLDEGASARVRAQLGGGELASVTAVQRSKIRIRHDEDFGAADEFTRAAYDSEQWSQELRFTKDDPDRRYRWLTGVFLQRREFAERYHSYLPISFLGYDDLNEAARTHETAGVFVQAHLRLPWQLELTTGLRWDYDRRRILRAARVYNGTDADTGNDVVAAGYVADASWSRWSPRIALARELGEHARIYMSAAMGYRAGGFDFLDDSPHQSQYDPEKARTVEAGVRTRWADDRLHLDLTLYETEITDLQLQQFLGTAFSITNVGEARSRGGELEGSWRHANGLFARLAAGYTDAVFRKYNTGLADLAGNKVPSTPRYDLALVLGYGDVGPWNGQLEWQATGRMFFDEANANSQESYELVNARIERRFGRFTVAAFGKNLLDRTYITSMAPGLLIVPGMPRTYGISVRAALP